MDAVPPDVEQLDFTGRKLGADGWKTLAAMNLPKLRTLWVSSTYVKDGAGIAALATATGFPALRKLHISGEILLNEEDLLPLARFTLPLEELGVCEMHIGDKFVRTLVANPRAKNLRAVQLHETDVTQAGARVLASLPNLVEVGLTRTRAIPYNAWTDWNGAAVGGEDDAAAWEEVRRMFPRAKVA